MFKKIRIVFLFSLILLILSGCSSQNNEQSEDFIMEKNNLQTNQETKDAIFAGGCFWCIESAFDGLKGVKKAESGYIGGEKETANYQDVSTGTTNHYEAVKVTYYSNETSYEELLDIFFRQIDPTDPTGQFADKGPQYQTAVFYATDEEKNIAQIYINSVQSKFDTPIVTRILPISEFYLAEEYHQDYAKKKVFQYESYKKLSGRSEYIKKTWKD